MNQDEKTLLQKRLSISTLIVMSSTALSRILGFVRAAVISAFFGGAGAVDVYNAVFIIPNNLRNLLAEGALSSAFIPVLTRSLVEDPGQTRAKNLVRTLTGFQFVVLIPLLVLCVIFAEPIVRLILPFPEASQQLLAVKLFQFLINYTLLVSISSVLMAVLNSHNRFASPALAPLMFSIVTIAAILLWGKELSVFSLVVGVLVGGVFQILVMLPAFYKSGYSLGISVSFASNPDFKRVLALWGPVVGTAAIFSLNEQIAVFFVSSMEPGSATALSNALLFWQLPFGIFSASITTVLFPRMSRCIAENNIKETKHTVTYGIRMLAYLLIPSALVLMILGKEMIAVAFQRAAFTFEYSKMAADVLWAYSTGLFSVGASRFLQRYFYAKQNNKMPLISAIGIVVIDVVLSLLFIQAGWGVSGLAYAYSIASTVGLIFLYVGASRDIGGLDLKGISISILKTLISCIPMVVGLLVFLHFTGNWWLQGSTLLNLLYFLIAILFAALSVFFMYLLLKVEVIDFVLKRKTRIKGD